MTLLEVAVPGVPVYGAVLRHYYGGAQDELTLMQLQSWSEAVAALSRSTVCFGLVVDLRLAFGNVRSQRLLQSRALSGYPKTERTTEVHPSPL